MDQRLIVNNLLIGFEAIDQYVFRIPINDQLKIRIFKEICVRNNSKLERKMCINLKYIHSSYFLVLFPPRNYIKNQNITRNGHKVWPTNLRAF